LRFIITFPNPLGKSGLWIFALLDMAEIALHAERSSDKIHHQKKLRVRQTLEHLSVLARLLDGLFTLSRLRRCKPNFCKARTPEDLSRLECARAQNHSRILGLSGGGCPVSGIRNYHNDAH